LFVFDFSIVIIIINILLIDFAIIYIIAFSIALLILLQVFIKLLLVYFFTIIYLSFIFAFKIFWVLEAIEHTVYLEYKFLIRDKFLPNKNFYLRETLFMLSLYLI